MDLQAMARVWRDGQKKPCVVYRLLTTGGVLEGGRWASGCLPACLPAFACLPHGPGASNTAAALVSLPPPPATTPACHLPPGIIILLKARWMRRSSSAS